MLYVVFSALHGYKGSNNDINQRIGNYLQENEDRAILVMGDFNAHTGQLGEPINRNGKLLIDLIEKNNLVNLNGTLECEGKVTWEARGLKSAIDYALANQKMMDKYVNMKIDEEREVFDLSDHCMIKVALSLRSEQVRQKQNDVIVNCMTKERREKFVKTVKGRIGKNPKPKHEYGQL